MNKTHIITLCPLYHARPEREIKSKVRKTVCYFFLLEVLKRYWSKCELNMSCFLCSAPRVCVKTTDAEAHQVKKLSLVVITFFLQSFRKRLSFRKKEESPVMRRRTKSQVAFKRKRTKGRSEMIYSNILQIGEDERRRSSGGWVFNYALNRSIMLSLFQLCSYFLNYSPPPLRTFLNGLSIYDSSPHIVTRHIQVYKHIKTHEEKHA